MLKLQIWSIFLLFIFLSIHFGYSQDNNVKSLNNSYNDDIYKKIIEFQSRKNLLKANINDYLISYIDSGNLQYASYYLRKGANPNYCDTLGLTPLMVASMNDDTNITKLLIKKGAEVNFRNQRGENALVWATIGRKIDQLKILIDNNAEVNIKDEYGISPIFYALGYYKYDLLNYANEDYQNIFTPDTSISTTYNLLQLLVKSGADINLENELDCTPLLFATFQKDTSLIKILCNLGANPNKTTHDGVSPLIYAIQEGSYSVVKVLIEHGANVNYILPDGNNAIFTAVRANNDSIAELLLQNNAIVNAKNRQSLTPLHYAAGNGFPFITNLLVSYGAGINESDINGNTPIISSVYSGAENVLDILIRSGADVNKTDNNGNTPIMIAAQFNDTILIRKLFDAGADLNILNKSNSDALSIAIENNSIDAFKYLIELGTITNNSQLNKSYYQLAREVGCTEIKSFIESKGLKSRLKPNISDINIYSGFSTSQNDFMLDFGGGIYEPVSHTLINIGYKYRPYSNRVLEYKNYSFYQFWEKRYSIYLSLQHLLVLKRSDIRSNIGFVPGISNEFTWNYYRGLEKGSGIKWTLVPSLGLFYQRKVFTIIGKWEFANYRKQISGSNRFNLQLLFSIPTGNRFVKKRINWLD